MIQGYDADLFDAVEHGNIEYAKMLLDNNPGIDVDYQDGKGWTLLMLSAYYGHVEMTSLILSHDPDLNIRDSDGAAAIDHAWASEHKKVAELLFDHNGPKSTLSINFVPSKVEGLEGVQELTVSRQGLKFATTNGVVVYNFITFSDPQESRLAKGLKRLLMIRPWPVGERDWFHHPPDRFFRFFTKPPITVYMPEDGDNHYSTEVYIAVRQIIGLGGFLTYDLG